MTEDQKNPDVLYIGTETGLFVSIDRGEELDARQGEPADRAHRRDHAASARQRDGPRDARPRDLDPRSPRADPGIRGGAGGDRPTRSCSRRRRRRCTGGPARDRNYEFWGDQTFYGENPPQAAVISWLIKKPVGEVELKITDAAGREVREISGTVLANSNKAGIQSACWDLRVQPAPAPPPQDGTWRGRGERGAGRGRGGRVGGHDARHRVRSARAAAAGGGGRRRRVRRRRRRSSPGRTSSAASTTSRWSSTARRSTPSRCASPTIRRSSLTSAERKRMYDMAMEMHALQPRDHRGRHRVRIAHPPGQPS